MIEQTIQTKGNATGQLGEVGKSGKGDAKGDPKGGLFAKLITSFQKHIKQTESHAQVDGQKTLPEGNVDLLHVQKNGLKKAFTKTHSDNAQEPTGKAKVLKVAHTDKTSEGESAKGQVILTKPLLKGSNVQAITKHNEEKQGVSNVGKLAIGEVSDADVNANQTLIALDGMEKAEKNAVGLGIIQQESREPLMKKAGGEKVEEKIFVGAETKNHKNTEKADKSPHLAMDAKGVTGDKAVALGEGKAGKSAGEVPKFDSKTTEAGLGRQSAQGRVTLNDIDTIDDGIDVSKLIKRDDNVNAKSQAKGESLEAGFKNQIKAEGAASATKEASSPVAGSVTNIEKVSVQDDINMRQGLRANLSQGAEVKNKSSKENVSKVKAPFQAVTANRSNAANVQAQASVSVASSMQSTAGTASSGGSDTSTSGDDRGTGRSAAELLMTDGSVRDTRSTTRSDFAMQMAYRSAASFKPADAMLEISKAAKDGAMKLDMMLEPATLGKIQVTLQVDAQKQIQVHMVVDQQTSRQVLEQQMPQLRQALADQGLNLSGFTMDMNSQQQNSDGSPRGGTDTGRANGQAELGNSVALDVPLRMGVNMANDGALSILA